MKQSTVERHNNRIDIVIAYMENNLDKKLRLIDLADVAMMSPYHLHRVFKQTTGMTIRNYKLFLQERVEIGQSENVTVLRSRDHNRYNTYSSKVYYAAAACCA